MHFVYILQSIEHPERYYTGLCKNVAARLKAHNQGQSSHTAKYKPWRVISFHHFEKEETAAAFERYLKSGSGRAFSKRHLR